MGFENRLKQILKQGYLAFGSVSHVPSTALIEIMGRAGFDFTMIDTEHGLYDIQTAGELIRAAHGANLTAIVRVLENDKGLITKALDLGAQGVVIPHVSSKEDVAKAVEACRYGPVGRGACPLVRAADYGLSDWSRYQQAANENIMVIVLVEDLTGVDNIENIISVDGIDAVYLGAFDMSVSAGYKGNVHHPEVQKALEKILSACRKRGVPTMHSLLNGRDVEDWVNKGVRIFVQSADSFIFARACKDFLDSVSHLRGKIRIKKQSTLKDEQEHE